MQLLFHGSPPSNAFGILSRGLLLPKTLAELARQSRRPAGRLGAGIYFASDPRTSLGYTKPLSDGRLLLFVAGTVLGIVGHGALTFVSHISDIVPLNAF